ncbi:hypothetical protein KCP76_00585 [Salmonella enterica subsp. enterica serovar Weltevreden]|nr:hypothetical protein KCP76_00585 [Salmonella enterica subsp. enterica serovar Weltevreden]
MVSKTWSKLLSIRWKNLAAIRRLKQDYPDKVLIASIMENERRGGNWRVWLKPARI